MRANKFPWTCLFWTAFLLALTRLPCANCCSTVKWNLYLARESFQNCMHCLALGHIKQKARALNKILKILKVLMHNKNYLLPFMEESNLCCMGFFLAVLLLQNLNLVSMKGLP